MSVVDEMIHVVVVSELLESFHKLSSSEESEVEEGYLLVWNKIVCGSMQHQCRTWGGLVLYLAFS